MAQSARPEGDGVFDKIQQALEHQTRVSDNLTIFAQQLIGEIHDDIKHYSPNDLAILTQSAFEFFNVKPKNQHKIRLYNPDLEGDVDYPEKRITIIEVLNDDMPFLLDSILGAIQEQGLELHAVLHPILETARDKSGKLEEVNDETNGTANSYTRESFLQLHLSRISDENKQRELLTSLTEILDAVRLVVQDWKAMLVRVTTAVSAYSDNPPRVALDDLAESIQFLKWINDNHFTFLGMREFELVRNGDETDLKPIESSGLGILRNPKVQVLRKGKELVHFTPEIQKFFFAPAALIVTKANVRSIVHRRMHMDYIGVKIYDKAGEISGELRIAGLFTSSAYTHSTKNIPFLRRKVDSVLKRSNFKVDGHSYKALINVLEQYPRDELFQVDVDHLYNVAIGILNLELRPRPRIFSRKDEFDRFVSVLVYVPRNNFSTEVRKQIGDLLATSFNGYVSAYNPSFPEGQLVRLHFIIGRIDGKIPKVSDDDLEKEIIRIVTTWRESLSAEIRRQFTGRVAANLIHRYGEAFSVGYEEMIEPAQAVRNIQHIERLSDENPLSIVFQQDPGSAKKSVRVEIYHMGGPLPLSQRVPILENMGFSVIDERSFRITPATDSEEAAISQHDMLLETPGGMTVEILQRGSSLEECFLAVWQKKAADDQFNQLVLTANLSWREASVFRALASYLRQIRNPFGQKYIAQTLIKHTSVTADVAALFIARFDPVMDWSEKERRENQREIISRIEAALENIPSLDEDRIIRSFVNLVNATSRTNFYLTEKNARYPETVAFKFKSRRIEEMPEPRPFAEIFVYSPRVEGIHLRGGRIARGGLRWSDRPQDFRTEVLSLAKAQQVKNTVIVPTGAKGGFVPMRIAADAGREEMLKEGIACYQLFISSLLSITDNLKDGNVETPGNVVCYDEDDPYLVVAADKGTAAFSDYANEISARHNFWLGDAFASGGSVGYDHKKMGITARGAWEAVKRHFREMDIDIQTEPIDVIGVGDMSGDVFGNGMLLSKSLRLKAAFDHRDIFIDPDPDPDQSWNERKRLFDLGRSSWQDYNRDLISKGGAVFSRQAKSITLTPEIQSLTGLNKASVTPNELIHAILISNADLLWFGGIGTYVRASTETNDQVGDRANDNLRVIAKDLDIKVIGEGANLGMTHRARIEFAKKGGRVNTDAIDNSAGVNSSDLEVNIKIALGIAMEEGHLDSKTRNSFLADMTDAVAEACLENNYAQSLAISLDERRGIGELIFQQRVMRDLETSGLLDRELEILPSDAEILERLNSSDPLTRPELSVLMAYVKIDFFNSIVKSSVLDDPYLETELLAYFPDALAKYYFKEIGEHRLRREIIATALTNKIINCCGTTTIVRLKEETGLSVGDIAHAFIITNDVFDIDDLLDQVDLLDNQISGGQQLDLYTLLQNFIVKQTTWFLKHVDSQLKLSDVTKVYRAGILTLAKDYTEIIPKTHSEHVKDILNNLLAVGVPNELANKIARLQILSDGPDIVRIASSTQLPESQAANVYWQISDYFQLDNLKSEANRIEISDYFDRLAVNSAIDAISDVQRVLTSNILGELKDGQTDFANWLNGNLVLAERTKKSLKEILASGQLTLSKLTVAVGQLRNL